MKLHDWAISLVATDALMLKHQAFFTARESGIKAPILVLVGTMPLPANQNIEYRCFHFAFQI